MPMSLKNGTWCPALKATAHRDRFRMKRRALASTSSAMAAKKRPTIKCSKRVGKNWKRKAALLEPKRGRNSRSNCDRDTAFAARFITRCRSARPLSRGPRFHYRALPGSRAGRLRRPIDAGCQSDKMASRSYHLVFRNVHFEEMDARISAGDPAIRFSLYLLL